MQQQLPVIDGATIIVVIAWVVSIKLAPTHTQQMTQVRNDNLALVILGALVVVVAWSTEGWKSYADTKVAKLRLHCLAEAWAHVALAEVVVAVLAAEGAFFTWHGDASALVTIATASAHTRHIHFMQSWAPVFKRGREK
jgi:hypothetical protein